MNAVVRAVAGIESDTAFVRGKELEVEYPLPAPYEIESIPQIFTNPVKNFGRFPRHVKAACVACALAFKAADIRHGKGERRNIALLAAGYEPTLNINREFFQDYLDAGRTMGRGNLFIYTLPTSAVAEVSIHFALTGPAIFIEADSAPFERLLDAAAQMLHKPYAPDAAVLFWQDMEKTLCAIAGPGSDGIKGKKRHEELQQRAARWRTPGEAIRHLKDERAVGF